MSEDWNREDPLWQVMGRAARPEPSSWLATRVMSEVRRCANRPTAPSAFWSWFQPWPASVAVGALAIFVLVLAPIEVPMGVPPSKKVTMSDSDFFAALEAFDERSLEDEILWIASVD